ncbi:ribosomal 40S subunit protein S13 [Stygiomarasmius scandens]|uniref:Ribosomal 40S subunit protein S13 n=1 Tax=Marasmiellus scandens TaxID=2682957 RepID=A0ABR1J4W0_9AGAR
MRPSTVQSNLRGKPVRTSLIDCSGELNRCGVEERRRKVKSMVKVREVDIAHVLKTIPEEVTGQDIKLARKGLTPSQIGVTLRDSHGIPQVRFMTGNKILHILKSQGLGPSIPEDLWHPIKKAVAVRKHLEVNRKDKDSKFRLILIESRIHRLVRYYKTKQQIPPTFKYDSATASTLIA